MNVEQWEDTYRPVVHVPDESESWAGILYETYGEDIIAVVEMANTNPRKVWTWIDTQEGDCIVNGYHLVNRIGHFITENEWQNGQHLEVETL